MEKGFIGNKWVNVAFYLSLSRKIYFLSDDDKKCTECLDCSYSNFKIELVQDVNVVFSCNFEHLILCWGYKFDRSTKIVKKELNSQLVGDIVFVTTTKPLIGW